MWTCVGDVQHRHQVYNNQEWTCTIIKSGRVPIGGGIGGFPIVPAGPIVTAGGGMDAIVQIYYTPYTENQID
jgi:hypothetical protein